MTLKNAQTFKRTRKEHTEAEERRRTFIFDSAQNHVWRVVSQLMFINATSPIVVVHVQLCVKSFFIYYLFISSRPGSG